MNPTEKIATAGLEVIRRHLLHLAREKSEPGVPWADAEVHVTIGGGPIPYVTWCVTTPKHKAHHTEQIRQAEGDLDTVMKELQR